MAYDEKFNKGTPPDFFARADEDHETVLDERAVEKLRRRAMNICLWHLERMDQTRKGLFDKLVKKEIPDIIIEETLVKLSDMGLVDDERYAENFVNSRVDGRLLGRRAVIQGLRQKGVDTDIIAEAISEVTDEQEESNAKILVSRKMKSSKGLDRQKRMNRLVGMLARKGYRGDVAFRVVRNALDEESDEDGEETWDE